MDHAREAYELSIDVQPGDIDQLDHVNNVTYLRWVQDAAVAHWNATAPVVLRHEIDYQQPAFLGDRILARTWVGTATRVTFERFTELVRSTDGRVLAKARTLWCPIDVQTGKPTAVSPEVRASFSLPAASTSSPR